MLKTIEIGASFFTKVNFSFIFPHLNPSFTTLIMIKIPNSVLGWLEWVWIWQNAHEYGILRIFLIIGWNNGWMRIGMKCWC